MRSPISTLVHIIWTQILQSKRRNVLQQVYNWLYMGQRSDWSRSEPISWLKIAALLSCKSLSPGAANSAQWPVTDADTWCAGAFSALPLGLSTPPLWVLPLWSPKIPMELGTATAANVIRAEVALTDGSSHVINGRVEYGWVIGEGLSSARRSVQQQRPKSGTFPRQSTFWLNKLNWWNHAAPNMKSRSEFVK